MGIGFVYIIVFWILRSFTKKFLTNKYGETHLNFVKKSLITIVSSLLVFFGTLIFSILILFAFIAVMNENDSQIARPLTSIFSISTLALIFSIFNFYFLLNKFPLKTEKI